MAAVKPHCGRCEWFTKFGNCGARLQGLIEVDGARVGYGQLVQVASPTWADGCPAYVDQGYVQWGAVTAWGNQCRK